MINIREATTESEREAVRTLVYAFIDWLRQIYPEAQAVFDQDAQLVEADLATLSSAAGTPNGKLLIAYSKGDVVGTVALRDQGQGQCEMKCMFVPEYFRGQGIGRALAIRLISDARVLGFMRMRLSTGLRQVAALSLYRSLGFQKIPAYHETPESLRPFLVFMELPLLA